jgi:hypothetical protein
MVSNEIGQPMNYYKILLCDNYEEINQEISKHISTVVDINSNTSFWNPIPAVNFVKATPLFQQWLRTQQLQIKALAVTIGTHKNCCGPHQDTLPARFKLSWPIQNTQTTFNRFFQPNSNCKTKINELGGTMYLDIDDLVEVDRMRVDQPALIDAQQPHDVWFEPESKFPRLGLQCHLMKEPEQL